MARRLIAHVRNQWMGALALFLILSGGYAIAGGHAFTKKQKAQATTIAQTQIQAAAPTLEVARAENAGHAEKAADATTAGTANSATSANFAQSAGSATTAVLGGVGRMGNTATCSPPIANTINCVAVTLTVPKPSRIVVTATYEVGGQGEVFCLIGSTGGSISNSGETYHGASSSTRDHITLTGVTGEFPAGTHSFGVDCAGFSGSYTMSDFRISAVALGPS